MELLNWLRNQWDRAGAWVLVSGGAAALLVGWLGVSRTPYTVEQIPYIVSGGLGGIFLLGLGAMLWLSADLRDEWRVLDEIRRQQGTRDDTSGDATAACAPPEVGNGAGRRPAGGAGGDRPAPGGEGASRVARR